MNERTKNITFYAVSAALLFLSMLLDRYLSVFLPVGFAVITLSIVYTIALVSGKLLYSFIALLMFGIMSFLLAVITGVEAFVNPLISVLPRAPLGLIAFGVYKLVRSIVSKAKRREVVSIVSAVFVTTTCNTLFVLSALTFIGGSNMFTTAALKTTLLFNYLPEMIIPAIIAPMLILRLRKAIPAIVHFADISEEPNDNCS